MAQFSSKFGQLNSLKGIRWEGPYAIVQTMRTSKTKYAEYMMLGFGTAAPANPFQGTNWVGPSLRTLQKTLIAKGVPMTYPCHSARCPHTSASDIASMWNPLQKKQSQK